MTRKKLPKAITGGSEYLRGATVSAVAHEAEPEPKKRSLPLARRLLPALSIPAEPHAAKRLSLARKIVERHKLYAAMGGLFPLPVVNIAGVMAVIIRMVKSLSDLYGVPFERDRARSIVVGLMGGAVPTGLAAATASTLVFVIPGAGLAGLAVSSVTAAALTRGIGLVFVDRFENGATALEADS